MSNEVDKPTDFDIENYSIEELINILGLGSEIPLTNEKIVSTIEKMKTQFQKNEDLQLPEKRGLLDNFLDFFNKINKKLLNYKKTETVRDIFDEEISAGGITRKAKPINTRGPRQTELFDKDIMAETRISNLKDTNPMPAGPFDQISTDYKNQLLRNTYKKLVTIDSHYRSILLESDCSGNTIVGSNNKLMEMASDFTVNLVPPLKNVLDITFNDVYIPHSWYVFSKDYGTNYYIEEKNDTKKFVKIEEIKYNSVEELVNQLNIKTQDISFNEIYSGKIEIQNKSGEEIIIKWYSLEVPSDDNVCNQTGFGGKVDYNLGWLLGFRETQNKIAAGEKIRAEADIDMFGSSYVYITLDDFNSNKPNQDLVSFTNNTASFSMPSYYVSTTMKPGSECLGIQDPYFNGSCGKKYANKDLSSNLTSAQRYTIEQIRNAMISRKSDRYNSPNSRDVFARILLDQNSNFTRYTNINLEYTKRYYFGPVNIKKLRIKLLNDKGIPIEMKHHDWNFSFYATIKYQN